MNEAVFCYRFYFPSAKEKIPILSESGVLHNTFYSCYKVLRHRQKDR